MTVGFCHIGDRESKATVWVYKVSEYESRAVSDSRTLKLVRVGIPGNRCEMGSVQFVLLSLCTVKPHFNRCVSQDCEGLRWV